VGLLPFPFPPPEQSEAAEGKGTEKEAERTRQEGGTPEAHWRQAPSEAENPKFESRFRSDEIKILQPMRKTAAALQENIKTDYHGCTKRNATILPDTRVPRPFDSFLDEIRRAAVGSFAACFVANITQTEKLRWHNAERFGHHVVVPLDLLFS